MSASREAKDRIGFMMADFSPFDGESMAECVWRRALEFARGIREAPEPTAAELEADPMMEDADYRYASRHVDAQRAHKRMTEDAARFEAIRAQVLKTGVYPSHLCPPAYSVTVAQFDARVDEYRREHGRWYLDAAIAATRVEIAASYTQPPPKA